MQLQAGGYLEPPEAGRGQERFFPRAFRGQLALLTPDFGLLASRTVRDSISFVSVMHKMKIEAVLHPFTG